MYVEDDDDGSLCRVGTDGGDMDGGDTEVSILAGVEVLSVAEGVPSIIVGVVMAELALWMVSKTDWVL